ncbi:MAG: sugar phosphate isomerase/epimerase [Clostridiales bacterium]|nr:sugar phosphate isomerase/epimerase [Clostridiales bacterium]
MFKTGIVSVTFRQKSISEIIALSRESGLDAIEIGSDVHAPKENISLCADIAAEANKNNIEIVSYGSYYKLGQYADAAAEFSAYISAAKALGTKNIRIWAGVKNSEDVPEAEREKLTNEAIHCAELAADADMTMSFEYHGGTLTNTCESALRLMREIDRPNVHLYWQPNQNKDVEFNVTALKQVLPYVSNVHVFAWDARRGQCIRYPLADHADAWKRYLDILASDGRDRAMLLEFVKGDSTEQFIADAKP